MNHLEFDKPILTPCEELNDAWTLMEDWTLVFRGETFKLKKGYVTDGASIPALLLSVCGDKMACPRLYAAMVHDWLYDGNDEEATREDADALYRDILIKLGYPKYRAWIEWLVLRIFGKFHWKGN